MAKREDVALIYLCERDKRSHRGDKIEWRGPILAQQVLNKITLNNFSTLLMLDMIILNEIIMFTIGFSLG